MRVGQVIAQARRDPPGGADTARDARLLVAEAAGRPVAWVLAHPEAALSKDQEAWLNRAFARYRRGEPLAYILGWWEFYGRRFRVDPRVLIPRPETETLVDLLLDRLRRRPKRNHVIDVGTGSGCIAITLAAEVPHCRFTAIDVSRGALHLARENAALHQVEGRIQFLQSDLLAAVRSAGDVVVANLPYVRSDRLVELTVAAHEPVLALDGGPDGLTSLRRLVAQLPSALRAGGFAALEIDEGQGDPLKAMMADLLPEALVQVGRDLTGRERFLTIAWAADR